MSTTTAGNLVFNVTENDIKYGRPRNARYCPIARAMNRKLARFGKVAFVHNYEVQIRNKGCDAPGLDSNLFFGMTWDLQQWTDQYDDPWSNKSHVGPMELQFCAVEKFADQYWVNGEVEDLGGEDAEHMVFLARRL